MTYKQRLHRKTGRVETMLSREEKYEKLAKTRQYIPKGRDLSMMNQHPKRNNHDSQNKSARGKTVRKRKIRQIDTSLYLRTREQSRQ